MEPTTRNGAVSANSVTQIDAQTVLVEMSELYTGCVPKSMGGCRVQPRPPLDFCLLFWNKCPIQVV